jgi:hypothetical protein
MMTNNDLSSDTFKPTAARIVKTGAVVGLLDGAFAFVFYFLLRRVSGTQLFQSSASALLGREAAFRGGAATATLGLAMHFAVAYGWTLVYAFLLSAATPLRELTRSIAGALAAGAVFGCCVWLVMDLVLVPMTRARATPLSSPIFWVMLAWHAVGIGWPIALLLRR